MEAKSVSIFSHEDNEKECEPFESAILFYFTIQKFMALLSPEWTDFMFWKNILYLSKSSILTEKRSSNDITNLRKKISKFMHLYWRNTWAEKIVQFFFSFAETFCCSKFPHLFCMVWLPNRKETELFTQLQCQQACRLVLSIVVFFYSAICPLWLGLRPAANFIQDINRCWVANLDVSLPEIKTTHLQGKFFL